MNAATQRGPLRQVENDWKTQKYDNADGTFATKEKTEEGRNKYVGVLAVLLVVSVVLSFKIRDNIEHDINKVNVDEELGKAVRDVDLMNIWDSLQKRSDAEKRYLQDHVCIDLDKNVRFVIIVKSNLLWSTFHSHLGLSSVCQTASSKIKCHCHLTEKSFIHPFTLKRGYH